MSGTTLCQTHTRASLTASSGFKRDPSGSISHQGLISCQNQFSCQLPIPNTHRCKYLEHLNLSGLDEHSTPADYNDLLHSAEVKPLIWMLMLNKTICGAPGEGALPQLDRGRREGVAQPCQPQPWHPRQQRHPQDCQQNMPKVLTVINVWNIDRATTSVNG